MPRYDLKVSYKEKDRAKEFGARWDARRKIWYFEGEALPRELEFWYPGRKEHENGVEHPRAETAVLSGMREKPEQAQILLQTGVVSRIPDLEQYKTVSEVNEMISDIYGDTPEFQRILVKGEVTNFDGHRGMHYYFSIKEETEQGGRKKTVILPCCMWETVAASVLKFELQQGQQVAIIGELQFYEAGGKTSLIVNQIHNIGEGTANLAFLRLKERLKAEGLFDAEHKKEIPKHPEKVGIVTSKDGQAIKDICKVAKKRNPYVQLVLYHVKVQGKDAVETIVEGIRVLDGLGLDSIIVGRGGGSDEELMVYNEERIARAVFAAKTPIISAVGHQGHFTLIDFVADKRVATPSEAAEETIPDIMRDVKRVGEIGESLRSHMRHALERRKLLLEAKSKSLESYQPEQLVKNRKERLDRFSEQMKRNMKQAFDRRNHRLEVALTRLHGLSPTEKLVGGFGYLSVQNKPVVSVRMLKPEDEVDIKIHDGDIRAKVVEIYTADGHAAEENSNNTERKRENERE